MTYHELNIWFQQRRALHAETKYVQVQPGLPRRGTNQKGVNTTVVACHPRRGTSNPELGAYRTPQSNFLTRVMAHRRLVALCYNPTPRLVKR